MLQFINILLPNRRRYINFSNPINGRQWLKLLRPDHRYGITFLPNLDLAPDLLGFSFKSNNLGLRGPMATKAGGVVLGTSFAMGLSVNNGENWYDTLLDEGYWFNAGMPVAPENHLEVLKDHYTGSGEVLLYLYHPNVWKTAKGYVGAKKANKTIFSYLGWETDPKKILHMYPKWILKEIAKSITGHSVYTKWNGRPFHFNAHYSWLDKESGYPFVKQQINHLNRNIFSMFDKVIAVRTPIKEDSHPKHLTTRKLEDLKDNYDFFWGIFNELCSKNVKCYRLDHSLFSEKYFHPFDTHWNAEGNKLFCTLAAPILRKEGVPGISSAYN